jgi:hypothetical protein
MARQKVVQIRCDRCKRVELAPPADIVNKQPDFKGVLCGEELVYEDICERCKIALQNLWTGFKEWEKEIVTHRYASFPDHNTAVPLTVAPDYSPPKPHSAAASKR